MDMSLIIVIAVVAVIVLFVIFTYNSLVKARELCNESFKRIGIVLQKRADMFAEIVGNIKGYKGLEEKYIDAFENARNATLASAKNPSASNQGAARASFGQALEGMRAISEAYPDLKSIAVFSDFQNKIGAQEADLENARSFYNGAVKEYNQSLLVFPNVLFAGMFGFKSRDYWGDDTKSAVMDQGTGVTSSTVDFS